MSASKNGRHVTSVAASLSVHFRLVNVLMFTEHLLQYINDLSSIFLSNFGEAALQKGLAVAG
jgi:hypothetical protein